METKRPEEKIGISKLMDEDSGAVKRVRLIEPSPAATRAVRVMVMPAANLIVLLFLPLLQPPL